MLTKKMILSVPIKAPNLLQREVDDNYGYAVNCSFPNSFRILNRGQYNVLSAINNFDNIQTLANRLDISIDALSKFLEILSQKELIRFDNDFSTPEQPKATKSLNFWIHTTNACNLGCSYCYIPTLNTGGGMAQDVREQLLTKFVESATRDGIKHIKLRLAGGEPLSQFQAWKSFIPQALNELSKVGCKLEASFITNLTMLTDEMVSFSKEYPISYGVSLDGIEEVHDATRQFRSGVGSFKTVGTNIRKLISANLPISINTVVSNNNLYGLPALTKYLVDLDIPFRYSIVKGEPIHSEFLEDCLSESYSIMEEAISDDWSFTNRYQFCDLKPNAPSFQTCASGFSGGAIYVDGTFKYCHVQFGEEEPSAPTIFDSSKSLVEMIDNGQHLEKERSADCKKCRYSSVCTSGCPVYRVDQKDPQCSIYHKFIPMYYHIQAKERLKNLKKHAIIA